MNTKMSYTEVLNPLHVWSEPKAITYEGKDPLWGVNTSDTFDNVQECTICGAMKRHDTVYYNGCDVMTIYPGSMSPCFCTWRGYYKAHGLEA